MIYPSDKECNQCHITKPIDDFYISRRKNGNFYQPYCKSCNKRKRAALYVKKYVSPLDRLDPLVKNALDEQLLKKTMKVSEVAKLLNLPRHIIVYYRDHRLKKE